MRGSGVDVTNGIASVGDLCGGDINHNLNNVSKINFVLYYLISLVKGHIMSQAITVT